jgi:hypothetical protein
MLFPGMSQLFSCIKDIGEAINAYQSGERDVVKLAATATGFDDWAREAGAIINQLNSDVSTVFSNAPAGERLPAAVNLGAFAVNTAANIVGGVQFARGISAFSRSGELVNPYAVEGTRFTYDRPVGDRLYRVWGGSSPLAGRWAFTQNPGNQITAIRGGALPSGNLATTVSEVQIVSATTAETSTVAPNVGQPGGLTQVHLSNLGGVAFSEGTLLPAGWMPILPWNFWCSALGTCGN